MFLPSFLFIDASSPPKIEYNIKRTVSMPTKEEVIDVVKQCYDPEIPINVYDLGLIYEIDAQLDSVLIKMSLTAAACPAAQALPEEVRQRVTDALGVKKVNVELTFDPPWTPERISPEGRKKLGLPDA
jgi:metal-sulfur cluster biosynthetic enzyme